MGHVRRVVVSADLVAARGGALAVPAALVREAAAAGARPCGESYNLMTAVVMAAYEPVS